MNKYPARRIRYRTYGSRSSLRRRSSLRSYATTIAATLLVSGAFIAAVGTFSVPTEVIARGMEGFTLPQRAPDEYKLAAQDKVRIRVYEFRVGEYQEWKALSGDFRVDGSGTVFLPLIGRMEAAGRSTSELAESISNRVKLRAGLKILPDASVEIVEYRPVYVVGEVSKPGEFSFRPNLTAVKALALAGGVYREAMSTSEIRQRITSENRIEQSYLELRRRQVRKARLEAELAAIQNDKRGSQKIAYPKGLEASPLVDRLLDDEQQVFQARLKNLDVKLVRLQELKKLYAREQSTLNKKIANHKSQIALAKEGARDVERLWKKKLVSASRRLNAKTLVAQLQGTGLDYEAALLRARQELSRITREIADAKSQVVAQLITDIQDVDSRIDMLNAKISGENALMSLTPTARRTDTTGKQQVKLSFTIKRPSKNGKSVVEFVANEDTKVLPGDVLKVMFADEEDLTSLVSNNDFDRKDGAGDLDLKIQDTGLEPKLEALRKAEIKRR